MTTNNRLAGGLFGGGWMAGWSAVFGVLVAAGTAAAQMALSPDTGTNAPEAVASEAPAEETLGSSTEQGHTPLDESFDWTRRAERIREQRIAALRDTVFNIQLRTMYLERHKYDDSESQAWAAGGSAGLKTGYFRNFLSVGATEYTSQPVDAPDSKDGTLMLAPGQRGYTVLGEIYADLLLADDVHLYAGRKAYDTPYINRNDVRMTPNTFEAATLQGKVGVKDGWSIGYGGGYFSQIKERNNDHFVSMSEDAGASVDRGVSALGGIFKYGDFSLGAIDYYSEDIINIAYIEAKHAIPLPSDLVLKLSAQYSDQQSVGDDLLKGDDFSTDQYGVKADLVMGRTTLTAAFTDTGDGADMQNPWSGYPGYTSVQVEDFYRAGESAVMLRAAYDFACVQGLSAYALWVDGTSPEDPEQFKRDEYDANLQWKAADGPLKGLMLRGRYAYVTQDGDDGDDLTDFRVICTYDLAIW